MGNHHVRPQIVPGSAPRDTSLNRRLYERIWHVATRWPLWVAPWFVLKDAIDNTQSVDADVIKAYLDNQPHPVMTLSG